MQGADVHEGTTMSSSEGDRPPWLTAALDQDDADAREFRRNSRDGFERMVRRHASSEDEVAKHMAWFDQQRGHLDAAVSTTLTGPGDPVPAAPTLPSPTTTAAQPGVNDREREERARTVPGAGASEIPAPRWNVPEPPPFEVPDAPDRSTRLRAMPAVYGKGLMIGLGLALAAWFGLAGLLRWLFDAAWFGLWPSIVTVPSAVVVLLVWMRIVHRDVRHWVKKGGPEPLRKRFK
jgi:hypothetical protein